MPVFVVPAGILALIAIAFIFATPFIIAGCVIIFVFFIIGAIFYDYRVSLQSRWGINQSRKAKTHEIEKEDLLELVARSAIEKLEIIKRDAFYYKYGYEKFCDGENINFVRDPKEPDYVASHSHLEQNGPDKYSAGEIKTPKHEVQSISGHTLSSMSIVRINVNEFNRIEIMYRQKSRDGIVQNKWEKNIYTFDPKLATELIAEKLTAFIDLAEDFVRTDGECIQKVSSITSFAQTPSSNRQLDKLRARLNDSTSA